MAVAVAVASLSKTLAFTLPACTPPPIAPLQRASHLPSSLWRCAAGVGEVAGGMVEQLQATILAGDHFGGELHGQAQEGGVRIMARAGAPQHPVQLLCKTCSWGGRRQLTAGRQRGRDWALVTCTMPPSGSVLNSLLEGHTLLGSQ